jgi:hypothetical protein
MDEMVGGSARKVLASDLVAMLHLLTMLVVMTLHLCHHHTVVAARELRKGGKNGM